MSLLEEARAEQHRAGGSCSVAPHLDDELSEALAAVKAKTLHAVALERALAKRGYTLKADTLRRHAKGECSCVAA